MHHFIIALALLLVTGLLTVAGVVSFSTVQPAFVLSTFVVVYRSSMFVRKVAELYEWYELINFRQPGFKSYSDPYPLALGQIAPEQFLLNLDRLVSDVYQKLRPGLSSVVELVLIPVCLMLSPLRPYLFVVPYLTARVIAVVMLSLYLMLHFSAVALQCALLGTAGPFRAMHSACTPTTITLLLASTSLFTYRFRDSLSRCSEVRRVAPIIVAVQERLSAAFSLSWEPDHTEEDHAYRAQPQSPKNNPLPAQHSSERPSPATSHRRNLISVPAALVKNTLVSNGFQSPYQRSPNPNVSAQENPFLRSGVKQHVERERNKTGPGYDPKIHARPSMPTDFYPVHRSNVSVFPYAAPRPVYPRQPMAPAVDPYHKPASGLRSSGAWIYQARTTLATTFPAYRDFGDAFIALDNDSQANTTSSANSSPPQYIVPDLVHDDTPSDHSLEVDTSSDEQTGAADHVKVVSSRSYGPHTMSSRTRTFVAVAQPKSSPMYAPKAMIEARFVSREEKPAALLKRWQWKQKCKRRRAKKEQTPNISPSSPVIESVESFVRPRSPTAPHTVPDESTREAPSTHGTPSGPVFVPIWSPVVSPTPSQVSPRELQALARASISTNDTATDLRNPVELPRQKKTVRFSSQVDIALFSAMAPILVDHPFFQLSPSRLRSLHLVPSIAEDSPPASSEARVVSTPPALMTPKDLAAAMDKRTSTTPAQLRPARPAPVYTLLDDAHSVVMTGERVPPNTQYQMKDHKGTYLRVTGPKGMLV